MLQATLGQWQLGAALNAQPADVDASASSLSAVAGVIVQRMG